MYDTNAFAPTCTLLSKKIGKQEQCHFAYPIDKLTTNDVAKGRIIYYSYFFLKL